MARLSCGEGGVIGVKMGLGGKRKMCCMGSNNAGVGGVADIERGDCMEGGGEWLLFTSSA